MAEARRSGGGAGRLALLVAIVALAVAWAAYRRQGGELRTLWSDLARGSGERARVAADSGEDDIRSWLTRAQARLERRRTDVAGERNLDQVREDVADLRAKLERAYGDSGEVARKRWRDLDGDLGRLEGQLKEGGSKAVATLDAVVEKIRRVAEEEEEEER
jgi:ElaB/YqjD/DUF883 family membrane-anchored ribosome-binding protein